MEPDPVGAKRLNEREKFYRCIPASVQQHWRQEHPFQVLAGPGAA